jgi:hypothetical protein
MTIPTIKTRPTETADPMPKSKMQFNRYLFENLICNLECQIESWIRKADSGELDRVASDALRLKAEGLGYATRLLNAFEPEFRELAECARHTPRGW